MGRHSLNIEARVNETQSKHSKTGQRGASRMPSNSLFFEKLVPILLALLGLVMFTLVLFAAGVLLGLVKF
jgi:hypothetical protein